MQPTTCLLVQGVQHLRQLQEAGLTHVHLLPSYDYGSVPERPEDQRRIQVRSGPDHILLDVTMAWFLITFYQVMLHPVLPGAC